MGGNVQTAIIIWMYLVGFGVSHSLLHSLDPGWRRHVIIFGWPITLPIILVLKVSGWLDRFNLWVEMKSGEYK